MIRDEEALRWCIYKGLDGIVADDLERFYDVCERWDAGDWKVSNRRSTWLIAAGVLLISFVYDFFFQQTHSDGFTRQRMSSKRTRKTSGHPAGVALSNIFMKPK